MSEGEAVDVSAALAGIRARRVASAPGGALLHPAALVALAALVLVFFGWYGRMAYLRQFPMQRVHDRLDALERRLDAMERAR
jgi:hypothetical protein